MCNWPWNTLIPPPPPYAQIWFHGRGGWQCMYLNTWCIRTSFCVGPLEQNIGLYHCTLLISKMPVGPFTWSGWCFAIIWYHSTCCACPLEMASTLKYIGRTEVSGQPFTQSQISRFRPGMVFRSLLSLYPKSHEISLNQLDSFYGMHIIYSVLFLLTQLVDLGFFGRIYIAVYCKNALLGIRDQPPLLWTLPYTTLYQINLRPLSHGPVWPIRSNYQVAAVYLVRRTFSMKIFAFCAKCARTVLHSTVWHCVLIASVY